MADGTLITMTHTHARGGIRHWRRLALVLGLTASFMAVEAIAGVLTNSLVLVADAAHMLTDAAALSLALLAVWFAQRPGGAQRTYGYYRAEILAALANAVLLFAVSGYVIIAAALRLANPEHTDGVPLLVVASAGLAVNLGSARLLLGGARDSLNVRAAFTEVLGDLLGSAGAIAAGIILITTGWRYADPLFAMLVGLLILPRHMGPAAWRAERAARERAASHPDAGGAGGDPQRRRREVGARPSRMDRDERVRGAERPRAGVRSR